jgi:hypothetical protein
MKDNLNKKIVKTQTELGGSEGELKVQSNLHSPLSVLQLTIIAVTPRIVAVATGAQ